MTSNDLYCRRSTLRKKVIFKQNKGHLGSRYIYVLVDTFGNFVNPVHMIFQCHSTNGSVIVGIENRNFDMHSEEGVCSVDIL